MTLPDSVLTIPPGGYSDPLGRFPFRYWDGGAWTSYCWNGTVQLDPYGTEQTPPWTARLRGAFQFSRTSLAIAFFFLIGCGVATFLFASPSQLSGDLAVWLFVPLVFLAQLGDRVRGVGWVVGG